MITRREFSRLALAGVTLPLLPPFCKHASAQAGVRMGAQTYSFRALPRTESGDALGPMLAALKECEITECELFGPQVEPKLPQDEARKWRLTTPLDHFRKIGEQFTAAGVSIYGFNPSFTDRNTDDEIDRTFEISKALGAEIIATSTTLPVAQKLVPFAEKHKMTVAVHNHSRVDDPNEFATPESFARAMAMSPLFKVNLDIGHFTAANYDAVAFIEQHHARITHLHLKDRKKNQGDNMPWGEGDTPIRQVLTLLKTRGWPIRAYVEYEYRGAGTPVEEVKRCLEYARKALA